jgi:RNA polymerase sigma-70 factor (ECF subfamily)
MAEADAGLIAAPRPDDVDAAERLVERYGERAYRLALSVAGLREDAEEAVADTMLKAARTIPSLTDQSALGSWIDRTVARAAHQARKRRQRVDDVPLGDLVPTVAVDGHFEPIDDWSSRIDGPALEDGFQTILAEEIDALPTEYRSALLLHDVEGLSKADVAEILDVDVPGVKARVHGARLLLRKRLSEYFEVGKQDSYSRERS